MKSEAGSADPRYEREEARHHKYIEDTNDHLIKIGSEAIKFMFLMNGGGIIVMLTFLASLFEHLDDRASILKAATPILLFAYGIACSAFSAGAAYLVTYCWILDMESRVEVNYYPFYKDSKAARRWRMTGRVIQYLAIFTTAISLILFVLGALGIRTAVSTLIL